MTHIFRNNPQREIAKIKRDFLRSMKGILPERAPSGQPLRWDVRVKYLDNNSHQVTSKPFSPKLGEKKSLCDCDTHYLELLTQVDDVANTYYRRCYHCGREWSMSIPQRICDNTVVVGERKYSISVRQRAPSGRMVDNNLYTFDITTRTLAIDRGIAWGY